MIRSKDMTITTGCVYTSKEPAQTFCSCGQPIELYHVSTNQVALPIIWIENGCDSCKTKYGGTNNL